MTAGSISASDGRKLDDQISLLDPTAYLESRA